MAELEEGVVAMCEVADGGVLVVMDPVISQVQDTGWSDVLVLSLNNMRIKSTLCDVLLVGKSGQTINAHATVLAAASTRFHELLHKSQSKVILNMPTVAGEVLQSVVDFVYQGSTKVAHAHLPELQKFASAFSMDNLFKACETSVSFTAGGGVATSTAVTSFESSVVGESGLSVMGDNDDLSSQTGENIDDSGYKIKNEPDAPVAAPITNARLTYDDDGDEAEPFAEPDDPETTSQPPAAPVMADNDDVVVTLVRTRGRKRRIRERKLTLLLNDKGKSSKHVQVSQGLKAGADCQMQRKTRYRERAKKLEPVAKDANTCLPDENTMVSANTSGSRHTTKVIKLEKRYPCDEGSKELCKTTILKTNRQSQNPRVAVPYAYNCKVCGRGMNTRVAFVKHIKKKPCSEGHDVNEFLKKRGRPRTRKKQYTCEECGRIFNRNANYIRHLHRHKGTVPFRCDQCGKGLYNKWSFDHHMKLHGAAKLTDEEKFVKLNKVVCDECGLTYMHNNSLKQHKLSVHRKLKRFACTVCDVTFLYNKDLRNHLLKHSGERPYVCEHCGASFIENQKLVRHIRIHTGEKPYKCRHCGKAFNQTSARKTHEKTHDDSKNRRKSKQDLKNPKGHRLQCPGKESTELVPEPIDKSAHKSFPQTTHTTYAPIRDTNDFLLERLYTMPLTEHADRPSEMITVDSSMSSVNPTLTTPTEIYHLSIDPPPLSLTTNRYKL